MRESAAPVARSFSREGLDRVGDYIRNEIAAGTFPGAILLIQQPASRSIPRTSASATSLTKLPMSVDTDLPPLLDVEGHHFGRGDDAGRGRQAETRRSRLRSTFRPLQTRNSASERGDDGTLTLVRNRSTVRSRSRICCAIRRALPMATVGGNLVRRLYAAADLLQRRSHQCRIVEQIAKLPLAERPGTQWDYSHSTDVLGRERSRWCREETCPSSRRSGCSIRLQ